MSDLAYVFNVLEKAAKQDQGFAEELKTQVVQVFMEEATTLVSCTADEFTWCHNTAVCEAIEQHLVISLTSGKSSSEGGSGLQSQLIQMQMRGWVHLKQIINMRWKK